MSEQPKAARRIGVITEPKMISGTTETSRVGGLVQVVAYLFVAHREPEASDYEACVMEAGRWLLDAPRAAELAQNLAAVLAPEDAIALASTITNAAQSRTSGLSTNQTFVRPQQVWRG